MMFFTPRMAMLAPLFWYTGFNQPYQLNTYGNRFFDSRALGIELAAFYAAEIAGGWVAGLMLDNNPSPVSAARRTLALFALATALGNALAGWGEVTAALVAINGSSVAQLPLDDVAIVPPTFAFLLWGFSDSQVQAYSYWLIRQLYEGGAEQARAVGFYKMVQSLGWTIGFQLMPAKTLAPIVQLFLTVGCWAGGTLLALFVMPPRVPRGSKEASLLDAERP